MEAMACVEREGNGCTKIKGQLQQKWEEDSYVECR